MEWKSDWDIFQRWLARFYPEHLDKYEKGCGKGEIDIVEVEFNSKIKFYHLYHKNFLLGYFSTLKC